MTIRYGCFNRKPYIGIPATPGGEPQPFRFAPDCQYTKTTLGHHDPKCVGCKHRQIKEPA
jgi:hypothetical protein